MNVKSAKNVCEFVKIEERDSLNRVQKSIIPGHEGIIYTCEFRRHKKEIQYCCAEKDTNQFCKGCQHSVCYHAIATLLKVTKGKIQFSHQPFVNGFIMS